MKNLIVAAAVVFFANTSFADFAEVKCLSPKETAEELLNIEASGRQHPDSTCMEQKNFPRYRVGVHMSPGGDSVDSRKPVILTGKQPYKIESVTKTEDATYKVKFEYKLSNGSMIKDELEFAPYQSGELKKHFGCAGIVVPPRTLAIHADCLPKR